MNPTLIPGFEDIITHIRQQEQRIKNLEQNEKVREARVQELYQENQQLEEKITCLESDSHNEVSQAEFDDMKEELEGRIAICEAEQEEEANLYHKLKEEKEKLYYEKMVSDNRVCTEASANLLLRNKNKVFEDQIDQQDQWFKAINILVGSDEDEPAVVSVKDFVAEHKKLKEQIKKD